MRVVVTSWLVLLLSVSFVPSVGAQEQPAASILFETDPDGLTYAGNLNRFGWILLDSDGAPLVHQNAEFTVSYRNVTIFSTTPSSGHDYDGVSRFFVAFPGEGDYSVQAAVGSGDDPATGSFTGKVDDRPAAQANLEWDPPSSATQGAPETFGYRVLDADGEGIAHAQVRFEVWNEARDRLVFATDTHAHSGEDRHELDYVFQEPGAHTLRVTAFHANPGKGAEPFGAFTTTHRVDVGPGEAALPAPASATPLENRVDEGEASGQLKLFASYDPYTSVGQGNPIRLVASVVNTSTMRPEQHVDFTAMHHAPDNAVLFESGSLHSYDGTMEFVTSNQGIGDHRLVVEAESTGSDWTGHVEFRWSVLPPAVTLTPGPHFVTVDGLDALVAGEPGEVTVSVASLAGQAFEHGEVHIRITEGTDGPILLAGKLHTHASGDFPFTFTPPTSGRYTLHVDPYPLTPSPPTPFHGADVGQERLFPFEAGGEADPFGLGNTSTQDEDQREEEESGLIPAPAAVVVLSVLGLLLAYRRRAA